MARTNLARSGTNTNTTYEGAPALPTGSPERELRRAVASCLLWENNFYESGVAIGDRIRDLAGKCRPQFVADLAVEARDQMRLRHAPLWLLTALLRPDATRPEDLAGSIAATIRRADEPGEIISMYRKAYPSAKRTLPAQLKRGVARALEKFDAYQLGKYNRKVDYGLKDVLRLTHPKPRDAEQAALWKSVVDGTLAAPDTWEVALSGGADKKETFERLLRENRLGYLALLRNLRKMDEEGVDSALVREAILARRGARDVLPFRFVAAAKAAPRYEAVLDEALLASLDSLPELPGETLVLVDVSGSMNEKLSSKSDLTRMTAAATLASIVPGRRRVFTFSSDVVEVPPRKGMAGVEAVIRSQPHLGTALGRAVARMNTMQADRLIVITDEQSHDTVSGSNARNAYMINVAGYKNEVGYGKWTRISGFSENVLRFVAENEKLGD